MDGVELVVLSACDTGLGKSVAGEGVLGLQRAFQSAGACSVIASLCRVDDQATQTLMVEFYKNLWSRKLGKLQALREAQLTMLHTYDIQPGSPRGVKVVSENSVPGSGRLSPRYWAAFVLSGIGDSRCNSPVKYCHHGQFLSAQSLELGGCA